MAELGAIVANHGSLGFSLYFDQVYLSLSGKDQWLKFRGASGLDIPGPTNVSVARGFQAESN